MEIPGHSDQSKNPMAINMILERLFNNTKFDTKTFASYRLVCKQWRDISLGIWRKNALLSVAAMADGNKPGVGVQEYLQLLHEGAYELKKHPFKRYVISGWYGCIDYSERRLYPERQSFWEKVGPLMTHLHIKKSIFGSTQDFTQIIFQLTPKLQYLDLSQNYYMTDRSKHRVISVDPQLDEQQNPLPPAAKTVDKPTLKGLRVEIKENVDVLQHLPNIPIKKHDLLLPITWMELLKNFANLRALEILHITTTNFTSDTEMIKILKTMENIRNSMGSNYFANMEELLMSKFARSPDFLLEISKDIVPPLRVLHFPLKVLTLNTGVMTDDEVLQQLLEIHAETLQHLTLRTGFQVHSEIAFPNFPYSILLTNLKTLKLSRNIVANFRFLKQMPNLEILRVHQFEIPYTKFAELNAQHVILENMKELQVKNKHFTDGQLVSLGKIMPNLTKLCIGLENKSGLNTVCNIWKELRHLNLNPLHNEDLTFMRTFAGVRYFKSNVIKLKYRKSFWVGNLVEGFPQIT